MSTMSDLRAGRVPDRIRTPLVAGAATLLAWAVLSMVLPQGAPPFLVLLGIVFGAITALLAMGLILVYRTNRIINFAYGAMGSLGGVVTLNLLLRHEANYFLALAAGVAVGVLVGYATDVLVIRRFADSSRLVLTVATIGLAQVLGVIELGLLNELVWWETRQPALTAVASLAVVGLAVRLGLRQASRWVRLAARVAVAAGALVFLEAVGVIALLSTAGLVGGITTPLSAHTLQMGSYIFNGNHALALAVVPVVIGGLAWFLLRTDAGIAVRAAAENSERALLLGIPVHRLSTIVWMTAGGIAALTFALRTAMLGSQPSVMMGLTFLLPALAAAVVARMASLPVAFLAGIGLGVLEQVVWWNADSRALSNVFFLVVILVALLARNEKLSRAFDAGTSSWTTAGAVRPLPGAIRRLRPVRLAYLLGGTSLLAAGVLAPIVLDLSASRLLMLGAIMVWGMVAVSLVVLTGWGGHISLGQFGFVGVGALVTANMVTRLGADLFVALAVAGVAGAFIALLLGLPALRIRGLFLAVTTLAFAVAMDSYFLSRTHFRNAIPESVPRPVLWQRFDMSSQLVMYYVILAFLVLAILAAQGVRRSRTGRVLIATRDNENAAQAAAVPTVSAKLTAFMFSGAIAGVAGGLYVVLMGSIGERSYQPQMSLEVFAMSVIGGVGSVGGALLGVFVLRLAELFVGSTVRLLLTGAALLFILYLLPGGLGQAMTWIRDRLVVLLVGGRGGLDPRRLAGRRAEHVDEPEDETGVLAGALADAPGEQDER